LNETFQVVHSLAVGQGLEQLMDRKLVQSR
jgi:hypothetical protein